MAAHIAFGNDYFCNQDLRKSAASASMVDPDKRAWLQSEYGVEIRNAQQLANLVRR